MPKPNSRLYSGLLLGVAVIWGTGFIATQIAIDAGFTPAFILMVRFILAALIFGVVFHRDLTGILPRDCISGLACGVTLFLGFASQTLGLEHTTPSSNAFITSSNIVLVPFLCWMLFRKRPPIRVFIGAVLCFAGVCALSWRPGVFAFGRGELLSLLCAICFAVHTTALGYFAPKSNIPVLNFLQLAVAAVLSGVYFFVSDRDMSQLVLRPAHISLVYLALFSTCLCYFIQTLALRHVAASKAAVIMATEALFAAVLSVALRYESIGPGLILGGVLVLTSVFLVEINFSYSAKQSKQSRPCKRDRTI